MIHWFDTTDSTMLRALELAREGAPHGTVAAARVQTGGKGRLGRRWESEIGGLYASIVLRLAPHPAISLALGVAAKETIESCADVSADLRWPNDVLIGERKCAGILAQAEDSFLIAGIGINVEQTSFPEGLDTPATSLAIETGGRAPEIERLLDTLVQTVLDWTSRESAEIRRAFEERSSFVLGRRVTVDGVAGVTEGLDENGFLLLRTDNGVQTISAGGVRPIC